MRLGVEAGLVLGLAFMGSQLFWQVVSPSGVSVSPQVGASGVSASAAGHGEAARQGGDFALLTTSNPFLPRERAEVPVSAAALNAPETRLNVQLKGVRANGDGAGVAFILLPDNRQVRASAGTEILDNVEVKYVFEDRVTLLTRGELETLYLRDPEREASGLVAEATAREVSGPARTGEVSAQRFLQSVSFAPVRENGARVGYRLRPRSDAEALRAAGFEPEDIVRRVNAIPVSKIDGEDLQELLRRTGIVRFEVERAGETVRVSVRFLEGDRR